MATFQVLLKNKLHRKKNKRQESDHKNFGYDDEQEAWEGIKIVKNNTMLPPLRLITLYQQALYCERANIEGSFVECGTWKGGATGLMAFANLRHGIKRRPIHLFDSFAGIPEPDETRDGEEAVRFARKSGGGTTGKLVALENTYNGVGTLEINKELLEQTIGYPSNYLHYHVGWFQETLPSIADSIGTIALLRLDGDWYSSTKVCLEHLYDLVVPGGFIVIDDYGCYEGCRSAVDEYLQQRNIKPYLHHIDSEGRYWVKST